jgi:hypothetical protein
MRKNTEKTATTVPVKKDVIKSNTPKILAKIQPKKLDHNTKEHKPSTNLEKVEKQSKTKPRKGTIQKALEAIGSSTKKPTHFPKAKKSKKDPKGPRLTMKEIVANGMKQLEMKIPTEFDDPTRSVILHGIPKGTQVADVRNQVEKQFGRIKGIRLTKNNWAEICFYDSKDAEKCVDAKLVEIKKHKLHVRPQPCGDIDPYSIVIKNLKSKVTMDEIVKFLKVCKGTMIEHRLFADDTVKGQFVCVVTFQEREAVTEALTLDGKFLDGGIVLVGPRYVSKWHQQVHSGTDSKFK